MLLVNKLITSLITKMNLKSILLAASLFSTSVAFSQTHKCASHDYLKYLDSKNPGMEQAVKSLSQLQHKKSRVTITYIPVVFHIVYKNAQENLTDDFINAQIDQLNRCYLRTNSDTTNMRSVFQPIVGPAKIQFILDKIIRVPTTVPAFDAGGITGMEGSDIVKFTANGGSDADQPTKKLNVWVCDLKISGQDLLLGYAYPPPGLPNWGGVGNTNPSVDGVVMDYLDIGGPNKNPKGYSIGLRGKSLVHEIGHYLGLRHIWGDDGGACQGDFDFEDDGVTDTPHQGDASQDNCDKVINSCIQSPNDMPDMVENYMDYSSANCQNSFTIGQVALMENVLATVRSTIKVPTSIGQVNENIQLMMYPNPAQHEIKFVVSGLEYAQGQIDLYSITGQHIRSVEINSSNELYSMNVSDLANGIYLAKIKVDNQVVTTQRICIEK